MDEATRATQSTDSTKPLTQQITETVAAELDTDPLDLDPLYHTIDPDALERLFRGGGRTTSDRSGRIVFEYCGCEVTVFENGGVDVERLEPEQPTRVIGRTGSTLQAE